MFESWRPLLSHFFPEFEPVADCAAVLRGYSEAYLFRIRTQDEHSYALRIWPRHGLPDARVRELHRFLEHLRREGMPVSVPLVSTVAGDSLVRSGEISLQLEPWLPGESRTGASISERETVAMMQQLARLHLCAEQYRASPSGSEWFRTRRGPVPAIRERVTMIQTWNSRKIQASRRSLRSAPQDFQQFGGAILERSVRCSASLLQRLQSLSQVPVSLFPCWRDLWRDHVLFEDGQLTGFIDPTATRADHPGTDLSRLLGSLFEDDRRSWQRALTTYQQVRTLDQTDELILQALDQSSVLLSGLTWIERWEMGQLAAPRLPDVVERLKILSRRLIILEQALNS